MSIEAIFSESREKDAFLEFCIHDRYDWKGKIQGELQEKPLDEVLKGYAILIEENLFKPDQRQFEREIRQMQALSLMKIVSKYGENVLEFRLLNRDSGEVKRLVRLAYANRSLGDPYPKTEELRLITTRKLATDDVQQKYDNARRQYVQVRGEWEQQLKNLDDGFSSQRSDVNKRFQSALNRLNLPCKQVKDAHKQAHIEYVKAQKIFDGWKSQKETIDQLLKEHGENVVSSLNVRQEQLRKQLSEPVQGVFGALSSEHKQLNTQIFETDKQIKLFNDRQTVEENFRSATAVLKEAETNKSKCLKELTEAQNKIKDSSIALEQTHQNNLKKLNTDEKQQKGTLDQKYNDQLQKIKREYASFWKNSR